MNQDDAIRLQRETAKNVIAKDDFGRIERVCGVDVAYSNDVAYCSAVVMKGQSVVESIDTEAEVKYLYIPGLLMLREAGPILETVANLKSRYDLLLVDGHGVLHPRKCGLACHVGVTLGKPTIGVAKSRLCGTVRRDGHVELDGQVLGYAIDKKTYVSVGHRISLETAVSIVRRGIEPLKLADLNSREQKRRKGLRP